MRNTLLASLLGLSLATVPVLARPAKKPTARPTPKVSSQAEKSYPYYSSSRLVDLAPYTASSRSYHRGFLGVGAGGFRFADGSRGRFWGVNIANRNLWIERAEIDAIVDTLARSGVNLVRFEAIDSRGGMLENPGQPGSRRINPEKFDTLHYWIAQLHKKGIYYYLDLIDFREFQPEDGVENAKAIGRAARPYAMFADSLIALQKEYALKLLTTVNPYTKLRPVDDPGLVLVEICNESGFFLYPKTTDNLVEPYRSQLQKKWIAWLKQRYPDGSKLLAAWGEALGQDEDLDSGNVRLPRLKQPDPAPRQRDGVEFLYTVQRQYFATMRDYLRGIGLKVPITAVVSSDVPADLASVSAELDFLSENHYTDHPAFGGADWEGKFFYNNRNCLRDANRFQFAPFTAQLRWDAKPVVVREWAAVWPNHFRASSVPEAAAYARLQDYDGMILFGYKSGAVGDRLVEFGYQVDPTVWDLFGAGALIFLRGDVSTPSQIAVLEYTPERLFRSDIGQTDLVRLAYATRVSCTTPQGRMPVGDLTIWPVREEQRSAEAVLKDTALDGGGVALSDNLYRSVNGQISRDVAKGRITISSDRTCCVAGELSPDPMLAGAMTCRSASPVGAILAQTLDAQPLGDSRHFLVKMVTVAENKGQKLNPMPAGSPSTHLLDQTGTPPVLTMGAPSSQPTVVQLGDGELVRVGMTGGTWELLVTPKGKRFWCDTAGISVTVQGKTLTTGAPGTLLEFKED